MFLFCLIFYQIIVYTNSYGNAMVINKNTSKLYKFCALQVIHFSLKFVGIVISSSYHSVTSSQIIPEPSIIFAK